MRMRLRWSSLMPWMSSTGLRFAAGTSGARAVPSMKVSTALSQALRNMADKSRTRRNPQPPGRGAHRSRPFS